MFWNKKVKITMYYFNVTVHVLDGSIDCIYDVEARSEEEALDMAIKRADFQANNGCSIDRNDDILAIPSHFIKNIVVKRRVIIC